MPPPICHLPLRMGGLGMGSAEQRYAAAPWTAWQLVIPTDFPDTDTLFMATSTLRNQQFHLQATFAHQMNAPSLLLKPQGAALRTHGTQKPLVRTIQRTTRLRLGSHFDNPIQKAIVLSQTAKNTRRPPPTTQQRSSRSRRGLTCTPAPPPPPPLHVPKRQRRQANMRMPHRHSPTTLHDLQKRVAV